jgi:hypothetical protein
MSLATTVSLVVLGVLIVVGAIGFLIDRHTGKLEPQRAEPAEAAEQSIRGGR